MLLPRQVWLARLADWLGQLPGVSGGQACLHPSAAAHAAEASLGQRDEGLLAHHLDILLLDVGVRPEQLSCEVLGAARPVDSAADASLFRIGHRLPLALVRKRTGHARAPPPSPTAFSSAQ